MSSKALKSGKAIKTKAKNEKNHELLICYCKPLYLPNPLIPGEKYYEVTFTICKGCNNKPIHG